MDKLELAAWLRLAATPGVGTRTARQLLAAFGLPQAVFAQTTAALSDVVAAPQAAALQSEPEGLAGLVEATWAWLQDDAQAPRQLLTLADARYPPLLLQTEDPPLLLHAIGALPDAWPDAIAVVGSRNPTPQGQNNAREFARSFAQAGFTVVSGLALGIDGAAHEGALAGAAPGQLPTIAVVGTGLDIVYPKRHEALTRRIGQEGLILGEYLLGTPPLPENFPKRNRIIAGLSRGTLVVEAAMQSGSLITARLAAEQGREVFAIPGSIHSPQARGCHVLLREGAKLVETAQDVLEELRPLAQRIAPPRKGPASEDESQDGASMDEAMASSHEDPLLAALGHDPVGLDALVARTGIAPSLLQARLLELELAGEVARLPGGSYQRVVAA